MRVAIQRSGNGGSDFANVTAFGKLAESCSEYLAKGRQVSVQGHLAHSESKTESGERRESHEVVANSVTFLGQRPAAAEPQPEVAAATPLIGANPCGAGQSTPRVSFPRFALTANSLCPCPAAR